jgi:hypothetical protein
MPILLKIPLDRNIALLYSKGIPLVKGMPQWCEGFVRLLQNIKDTVVAKRTAK